VSGKPYPISFRAASFEQKYRPRDPGYDGKPGDTFASTLGATPPLARTPAGTQDVSGVNVDDAEPIDFKATIEAQAIAYLRAKKDTMDWLRKDTGMPWRGVQEALKEGLPDSADDRDQLAYNLVPRALNEIFGAEKWESYKYPTTRKTWVRRKA
jgi:hypothetical protein